jgi:hypothetical protein
MKRRRPTSAVHRKVEEFSTGVHFTVRRFTGSPDFRNAVSAQHKAGMYFYANTRPVNDQGWRKVIIDFSEFDKELHKLIVEQDRLSRIFIFFLDQVTKPIAKERLGNYFDEADYFNVQPFTFELEVTNELKD